MAASLIISEFLIIPQTKFVFELHTAGDEGSKIEDLPIFDGGGSLFDGMMKKNRIKTISYDIFPLLLSYPVCGVGQAFWGLCSAYLCNSVR